MTRIGSRVAVALLGVLLSAAAAGAQDFVLRPGDAVGVLVPGEKDLTGKFDVDAMAGVTFPVIGRVDVGGKPWSEARTAILAAFRRQLREPGLTLTPWRRVVVLGAVNKPGSYLIDPSATLSGAIATASGVTVDGDLRRVRVVRDSIVMQVQAAAGRPIADMPMQSGDQIFVLERSWVVRNTGLLITSLLTLTGLIAAFRPRL